jgi:hypothetical protein
VCVCACVCFARGGTHNSPERSLCFGPHNVPFEAAGPASAAFLVPVAMAARRLTAQGLDVGVGVGVGRAQALVVRCHTSPAHLCFFLCHPPILSTSPPLEQISCAHTLIPSQETVAFFVAQRRPRWWQLACRWLKRCLPSPTQAAGGMASPFRASASAKQIHHNYSSTGLTGCRMLESAPASCSVLVQACFFSMRTLVHTQCCAVCVWWWPPHIESLRPTPVTSVL